jgi:outer membrane immunogenic protein
MKQLLLAATALISVTAVRAADLPARAAAPVAFAPAFTWTGAYVGLSLGGLFGSATDDGFWLRNNTRILATDPFGAILPPYSRKATVTGLLAGVQAGYNYQVGNIVAGVEADISGIAATGSQGSTPNYNALIGGPLGASCIVNCLGQQFTSQWRGLATLRGRLGFAVSPNWMIYGTGGLADADVSDRYSTLLNSAQYDQWRIGWVVGAGTEYALSHNLTMKFEGLYVKLGDKTYNSVPLAIGRTTIGNSNRFSDHALIARVGVNYKFD